jgi:hypothetical protein
MTHPIDDDHAEHDGDEAYEEIQDLKDTIQILLDDIEYLLPRAHRHLVDADRINRIKNRLKSLNEEG